MNYLLSRAVLALASLLFAFGSTPSYAAQTYSPEQLEQLVAPIALYPDPLLSQVLIASTYPIDIVEAARWRASQPAQLSSQQLSQLLQNQPWDPNVKAIVAFPDTLSMMNDKISWTDQLGEAFIDQQDDLMAAVQRLRARANAAGNLRSGPQQTVTVSGNPSLITILPARPDTIYVPYYNPIVVYGAWPYPDYMPYYWHSPRYIVTGPAITFAGALVVGGILWSTYDWRQRRIHIDVNRYNRFNHTRITSNRWHRNFEQRRVDINRNTLHRERFNEQRRANTSTPMHGGFNNEHRGPPASRGSHNNVTPNTAPHAPHRAQNSERSANVTRTHEPRGNDNSNRNRNRSEAARPAEQRQARPQERPPDRQARSQERSERSARPDRQEGDRGRGHNREK